MSSSSDALMSSIVLPRSRSFVAANADEIFLVSTTRDVQGVHRWDDRELPAPGPVTRAAAAAWRANEASLLGLDR